MTKLIYQVYPISFFRPHHRGDIRPPLRRIIDILPKLSHLGVEYLWLSPIYPSPLRDHGYDISCHTAINDMFGDMGDFKKLVKVAHRDYDIKILMDLVLNHTSVKHEWFRRNPEYYFWSEDPKPEWQNLFDSSSCWELDQTRNLFYLHLFHRDQADLDWFTSNIDGEPNPRLIEEFQNIVDFWIKRGVDGFRLDIPQCINKDYFKDDFSIKDTADPKLIHMAADVINGIFTNGREKLYLLMECYDVTGKMCEYYYENTPVNSIMDISVRDSILHNDIDTFIKSSKKAFNNCPKGYAHVTESHDSPRFPSIAKVDSKTAIDILFGSYQGQRFINPDTIVMYQGQELGLKNPDSTTFTNERMLGLDAMTAIRSHQGVLLEDLIPTSRANARVAIPFEKYDKQEQDIDSCFNYTMTAAARWRLCDRYPK